MSDPGAADDDPFRRIGHDVADILRAASRAAASSQERAEAEAAETLSASRAEAAEIVAEAESLRDQARLEADEIVNQARARADRLIESLRAHEGDARAHIEAAVEQLTLLVGELEHYSAEVGAPPGAPDDDTVIDLRDPRPTDADATDSSARDEPGPEPAYAGASDASDAIGSTDATTDDATDAEVAPGAVDAEAALSDEGSDAAGDEPGEDEPAGGSASTPESETETRAEHDVPADAEAEPVERALRSGVARAVSGFLGGERRNPRPRRDQPDGD